MATKKFPHAVIYNGKLYPANTEITVAETVVQEKEAVKPAKKAVNKDGEKPSRKA